MARSAEPRRPEPLHAAPRRSVSRRRIALAGGLVGVALVAGAALGGNLLSQAPISPPLAAAAASQTPDASATARPSGSPEPGARTPSSAEPGQSQPSATASSAPSLRDRLQATLDKARKTLAIPGVSATVLLPDGTTWTGVSGLADVAAKRPVTPDTAFAFASISKTLTSAVVLQLVDEGRLALTDSAAELVPAGLPIKLNRAITVGMLLDHTSGLPDYFLNPKIDPALRAAPTKEWTAGDALRFVGKPLAPPGRAFHYANTNYLLLGLIAEKVSGEPLDKLVRERLLTPLSLGSTWYQAEEKPRTALADGYLVANAKARPVDLADGSGVAPFRSVITAAGGAGSIAGTSKDLATWANALYSGRVLGADGTRLLLGDFGRTTGYVAGVWYGLGVQSLPIDGHRTYGHSGRLLGFRGAVRDFVDDGFTIAVLTNQSRADPAVIVRALERVMLPPPPKPAPSPKSSGAPAPSASAGG
jgi:D-alanyl-D-alanine carboxypeptidase